MIPLNTFNQFTGNVASDLRGLTSQNTHTYSRKGVINRLALQSAQWVPQNNIVPFSQKTPGRQLFEYFVADLSNVSMHFTEGMRSSLTLQMKELVSDENWDTDDTLPRRAAFATLFRFLSIANVQRTPSIGANGAGSLTVSWFIGPNRLTLDCFDRDRIIFVLTRIAADGRAENAAGETRVPLLLAKLHPYDPDIWFR